MGVWRDPWSGGRQRCLRGVRVLRSRRKSVAVMFPQTEMVQVTQTFAPIVKACGKTTIADRGPRDDC